MAQNSHRKRRQYKYKNRPRDKREPYCAPKSILRRAKIGSDFWPFCLLFGSNFSHTMPPGSFITVFTRSFCSSESEFRFLLYFFGPMMLATTRLPRCCFTRWIIKFLIWESYKIVSVSSKIWYYYILIPISKKHSELFKKGANSPRISKKCCH